LAKNKTVTRFIYITYIHITHQKTQERQRHPF